MWLMKFEIFGHSLDESSLKFLGSMVNIGILNAYENLEEIEGSNLMNKDKDPILFSCL